MELFALYFNLLLFYIELSTGFRIIFDAKIYFLQGFGKKKALKYNRFRRRLTWL